MAEDGSRTVTVPMYQVVWRRCSPQEQHLRLVVETGTGAVLWAAATTVCGMDGPFEVRVSAGHLLDDFLDDNPCQRCPSIAVGCAGTWSPLRLVKAPPRG